MKDNKPEYFLIIEDKFILMDIDNVPNLDKDSYFDMNVFDLANNKELLNKLNLLYCDFKELPWSKNTPEKIFTMKINIVLFIIGIIFNITGVTLIVSSTNIIIGSLSVLLSAFIILLSVSIIKINN